MNIFRKLLFSFFAIILLLGIMGYSLFVINKKTLNNIKIIKEHSVAMLVSYNNIFTSYTNIHKELSEIENNLKGEEAKKSFNKINSEIKELEKHIILSKNAIEKEIVLETNSLNSDDVEHEKEHSKIMEFLENEFLISKEIILKLTDNSDLNSIKFLHNDLNYHFQSQFLPAMAKHLDMIQQHIEKETNMALNQIFFTGRIIVIFTIILIFVFLLSVFLISRSFSRRISKLRDATIEASKDNLELRVEITGNDEISDLEKSFNKMLSIQKWTKKKLMESYDELEVRSEQLEKLVTDRTSHLQEANKKLENLTEDLKIRNRNISLVKEMTETLQASINSKEAYTIISGFIKQLFPNFSGALYVIAHSRNVLELAIMWGNSAPAEQMFTPEDCWAIRRGRAYIMNNSNIQMLCTHFGEMPPAHYACIPLSASGEILGIMYLSGDPNGSTQKEFLTVTEQAILSAISENIAMTLSNLKLREILHQQSIIDPLTGLLNRRFMEETLERELSRAVRHKRPVGLMIMDIDYFKKFNDTFGHEAGDIVLKELAGYLKLNVRKGDIVCRFGGEELVIIMPESGLEPTKNLAEKLREGAQKLHLQYQGQSLGLITISIGVAVFPELCADTETLLNEADKALYRAKAEGRNKVIIAKHDA